MAQRAKTAPDQRERAIVDLVRTAAEDGDIMQKDIASRVGISPAQLSRIFSGQKPVTLMELLAMLDAVGLDLESVVRDLDL